jgi:hypothetical protein
VVRRVVKNKFAINDESTSKAMTENLVKALFLDPFAAKILSESVALTMIEDMVKRLHFGWSLNETTYQFLASLMRPIMDLSKTAIRPTFLAAFKQTKMSSSDRERASHALH